MKNATNDEFLRKRKARQKQIRKRRAKKVFIFFLIVAVITGVILSYTVLFPIKNIKATGSKLYTSEQIIEYAPVEKGDNLLAVPQKKIVKILREKLPFIETVKLERKLPDTLKITVTDAKEYLCYKVDKKYYTTSKSGWVLASYKNKPKGIISVTSKKVKCKVGSMIEYTDQTEFETTESLIKLLGDNDITIDSISIKNSQNVEAAIEGRFIVKFGSADNLEPKIKHLKGMMENIGKKETGRIDLSMWNSTNTQGIFVQTDIK